MTEKQTWQEKYPIKSEWKTRGGWKAMVVDHIKDEIIVYHPCVILPHRTDGTLQTLKTDYDLLTTWKEPLTGEVWLNVYAYYEHEGLFAMDYHTLQEAEENAGPGRIGRMRVQLEERWDE